MFHSTHGALQESRLEIGPKTAIRPEVMSNLAIDELVDDQRESGTVVSGIFNEIPVRIDAAAVLGERRWKGRTRLAFFTFAVLTSWTLVVLAIYLLF